MGKGDQRTYRGKLRRHTFGKYRPHRRKRTRQEGRAGAPPRTP